MSSKNVPKISPSMKFMILLCIVLFDSRQNNQYGLFRMPMRFWRLVYSSFKKDKVYMLEFPLVSICFERCFLEVLWLYHWISCLSIECMCVKICFSSSGDKDSASGVS